MQVINLIHCFPLRNKFWVNKAVQAEMIFSPIQKNHYCALIIASELAHVFWSQCVNFSTEYIVVWSQLPCSVTCYYFFYKVSVIPGVSLRLLERNYFVSEHVSSQENKFFCSVQNIRKYVMNRPVRYLHCVCNTVFIFHH